MSQLHFKPTDHEVRMICELARHGLKDRAIADLNDCSVDQLLARCGVEVAAARAGGNLQLLKTGYELALGRPAKLDRDGGVLQAEALPNVRILMMLLERRCGLAPLKAAREEDRESIVANADKKEFERRVRAEERLMTKGRPIGANGYYTIDVVAHHEVLRRWEERRAKAAEARADAKVIAAKIPPDPDLPS